MSEIKYTEEDLKEAEEMAEQKGYEDGLAEAMAKIKEVEGGFKLPKAMDEFEVKHAIKSLFETVTEFAELADLIYNRGYEAGKLEGIAEALTPRPIDENTPIDTEILGINKDGSIVGTLRGSVVGNWYFEQYTHGLSGFLPTHWQPIGTIPTP